MPDNRSPGTGGGLRGCGPRSAEPGAGHPSRRRASLVAATLTVVAEAGGEAVTVREIADRAGVAAVSKYYGSKEQLLYATVTDVLAAHLTRLESAIDRRRGLEPRLRGLVDELLAGIGAYREVARAMARAEHVADAATIDEAASIRGRIGGLFARCVHGVADPRCERRVGELLFDVWVTNASALINGRADATAVRRHVVLAGLLFSRRSS